MRADRFAVRALARRSVFLVSLLLVALGCRGAEKRSSERLPPLTAPSWRIDLEVEGAPSAVVAVPLGATEPRPIVIALHGGDDRPEWQCGSWRGIVGSRAFVLCPRGRLREDTRAGDPRYAPASLDETERGLRAALSALKRRFPRHVAAGPVILAGLGPGAEIAVLIAKQEPAFFARLALLGRGSRHFTPTVANLFGKSGGKRVLFLCSTSECRDDAEPKALLARRAGAEAKVIRPAEIGPWFDQAMVDALRAELGWLTSGDRRWAERAR